MEKSGENLAGAIEVLDRLMTEEQTQSSTKSPFRLFELSFLLVKSHLQYAAILSHLITHDQALRHAQLSKEKVRDCARLMKLISLQGSRLWERSGLEVMLEKFIHEVTHRDPTSSDYKSPMVTGPLFKKKSQSSSSVNRSEQATRSQVDVSADQYASGIIFWKHNQKNNEKYLKQELAKRYGDSFQGKKMNTEWLQLFNIGNIMHVTPVTYRELLSDETDHNTILTEDRLVELMLVYSCCLFSIATENRFICHRELDTDKSATELSGPAKTVAKNYQLLQNHNFKQSEVYHFKAIEILCSFVSDCSLLNHFLSSYQKNYTPNLETITEEETLLEMSLRDLTDQSRPQSTLDDSTPILARQSLQHEEYRAGNKPTDKKKRQTSKLDVLKNKFTFKKLPKLAISVGQQRPRSNEKGLMVPKRAKLTVSVEQMGTKNRMGQPVRSNSPALATKAEKNVKRKGLNNRTVQQILEGMNLDKHKLDEFIKSQGFRPINEAAAKITSGLLSKKASAGKLHIGPQASRGGSRKASSSRTKCSSPQASQSQTERPRERQTADSGGQSLNIKIENKDFVARMMNINIIKIKPDTRSDQCFCRKRFDKPGERKKSAHLQTNLSSGTKSRGASTESKAEKNKNECGKADDDLFRSGTARPNKSKETQSRNASRKDSSSLQLIHSELSRLSLTGGMRKTTDTGMEALDTLQPASQTMRESAVPKQRLFTLINDIHDSAEPTGMSQARFSTLMKRQATGEKHADKTACSQLARLAQNQGISTATGMKKTHIKIGNFKS